MEVDVVDIHRHGDSGALCARFANEKHYVLSVHSCERHEGDDPDCLEIRFLAHRCHSHPNEERGPSSSSSPPPKKRRTQRTLSPDEVARRLFERTKSNLSAGCNVPVLSLETAADVESRLRDCENQTTAGVRAVLRELEEKYKAKKDECVSFYADLKHLIQCLDICLEHLGPGDSTYEAVCWKHRLVNAAVAAGLDERLALVMLRGLALSNTSFYNLQRLNQSDIKDALGQYAILAKTEMKRLRDSSQTAELFFIDPVSFITRFISDSTEEIHRKLFLYSLGGRGCSPSMFIQHRLALVDLASSPSYQDTCSLGEEQTASVHTSSPVPQDVPHGKGHSHSPDIASSASPRFGDVASATPQDSTAATNRLPATMDHYQPLSPPASQNPVLGRRLGTAFEPTAASPGPPRNDNTGLPSISFLLGDQPTPTTQHGRGHAGARSSPAATPDNGDDEGPRVEPTLCVPMGVRDTRQPKSLFNGNTPAGELGSPSRSTWQRSLDEEGSLDTSNSCDLVRTETSTVPNGASETSNGGNPQRHREVSTVDLAVPCGTSPTPLNGNWLPLLSSVVSPGHHGSNQLPQHNSAQEASYLDLPPNWNIGFDADASIDLSNSPPISMDFLQGLQLETLRSMNFNGNTDFAQPPDFLQDLPPEDLETMGFHGTIYSAPLETHYFSDTSSRQRPEEKDSTNMDFLDPLALDTLRSMDFDPASTQSR